MPVSVSTDTERPATMLENEIKQLEISVNGLKNSFNRLSDRLTENICRKEDKVPGGEGVAEPEAGLSPRATVVREIRYGIEKLNKWVDGLISDYEG